MTTAINWYPGHMFKAKKELISSLKIIDIVIEVIDARVPFSSHNEMLDEITKNKEKIIIITKKDLVNAKALEKYINQYQQKNYHVIAVDINNNVDRKKCFSLIKKISDEIFKKHLAKGIKKTPRIMIIGMPNVGKSSIINFLAKQKKVEVSNKPGVTKKQQWISIDNICELLDTPGIMVPKINDITRGYKLVCCSLIKDEVVIKEHVGEWLITFLQKYYLINLEKRYNIKILDDDQLVDIYEKIAKHIGAFKNNECDYDKVSVKVINDFRKQQFGNIILDQ